MRFKVLGAAVALVALALPPTAEADSIQYAVAKIIWTAPIPGAVDQTHCPGSSVYADPTPDAGRVPLVGMVVGFEQTPTHYTESDLNQNMIEMRYGAGLGGGDAKWVFAASQDTQDDPPANGNYDPSTTSYIFGTGNSVVVPCDDGSPIDQITQDPLAHIHPGDLIDIPLSVGSVITTWQAEYEGQVDADGQQVGSPVTCDPSNPCASVVAHGGWTLHAFGSKDDHIRIGHKNRKGVFKIVKRHKHPVSKGWTWTCRNEGGSRLHGAFSFRWSAHYHGHTIDRRKKVRC